MTWVAVGVIVGGAIVKGVGDKKTAGIRNASANSEYNLGSTSFDTGSNLENQGLGQLGDSYNSYKDDLANPLGTGPNSASGIFSRARGALSDNATRTTGAFGSRMKQLAVQSGGTLSPAAQAQLEEQNSRDVQDSLFQGNVGISNAEASATLTQTNALFDRMDNISKTILGVGVNEKTLGLQAMLAALGMKTSPTGAMLSDVGGGLMQAGGAYTTASKGNTTVGHP